MVVREGEKNGGGMTTRTPQARTTTLMAAAVKP